MYQQIDYNNNAEKEFSGVGDKNKDSNKHCRSY